MKAVRIFCLILISLVAALTLRAGNPVRERVYISTDRDVYVAGDRVWMSAYCIDASTGSLSAFSKTAYLELHSPSGTVHTSKIALEGGRGAGRMALPNTLPTGNYRILAYTLLGAAESGFDATAGAHTISVYNTFSTSRVDGGVTVAGELPSAPVRGSAGFLALSAEPSAPGHERIRVTNNGTRAATFSLSVSHSDIIPAPQGADICTFVPQIAAIGAPGSFNSGVVPEYEGEIIRARVAGISADSMKSLEGKYAFLSSPGDGSFIYSSSITADGTVSFFTTNIYGEKEMFLEIEGLESDNVCHLEVERPFLDLPAGEIPPLQLYKGYADALQLRSLGMQLERSFDADTLYTPIPSNTGIVFDSRKSVKYILDDYVRFPLMEEVISEYVQEVRIRTNDGVKELQVRAKDPTGNGYFTNGTALVLLDGVPVLNHSKILEYDPLLVRRIDIYSGAYLLGIRTFRGVVNFITYKGTLEGMQFEDNVRIINFQGCAVPEAFTCEGLGDGYPDYRQTLYWHPLVELAPGESLEIDCKSPLYEGDFRILAEGLDDSGGPLRTTATFTFAR